MSAIEYSGGIFAIVFFSLLTLSRFAKKSFGLPLATNLRAYTPFNVCRWLVLSLFAPLLLIGGIIGVFGAPFSSEPPLQAFVTFFILPLGLVSTCVHCKMHYERIVPGRQGGCAIDLVACTIAQSVVLILYFSFRPRAVTHRQNTTILTVVALCDGAMAFIVLTMVVRAAFAIWVLATSSDIDKDMTAQEGRCGFMAKFDRRYFRTDLTRDDDEKEEMLADADDDVECEFRRGTEMIIAPRMSGTR